MRQGVSVLGYGSARVPTAGTWEVPSFSFWVSFPSRSKRAMCAALVRATNTRFPKTRSLSLLGNIFLPVGPFLQVWFEY